MTLRYILITLSLLGLSSSASYSQSEFIDRSFGDNGTVTFENNILISYSFLGLDSLENIYILHGEVDTSTNIRTRKLIKLNERGETIFYDKILDEQDSTSIIDLKNSTFIKIKSIDKSSIISTYDLDFNPINRFIIPAKAKYETIIPLPDGSLEGLTTGNHNTFFKFGPDGQLDESFGDGGLISLEQDTADSHIEIDIASRQIDNSLLLTAFKYNPNFKPLLKLYSDNGQLISDFSSANFMHPSSSIADEEHITDHLFGAFLTKDKDVLIHGYNTSYRDFLEKMDIDGYTKTNFADNGFLIGTPDETTTSTPSAKCEFNGQLSNGYLLHVCNIWNQNHITSSYLTLYNEDGIKEQGFGKNGKINLDSFKGQYSNSQFIINDDLYVIKNDAVQNYGGWGAIYLQYTATHITRISSSDLFNYESTSSEEIFNFSLFPNPITSKTLIEYDGRFLEDVHFRIYNLNGQLLQEQVIAKLNRYDQIPVAITDYPKGIYLMQIVLEGKTIWSTKIIKTN